MRSTAERVFEPKNNTEEELKSLQKKVSNMHLIHEGWKRRISRGPNATLASGYDNKTIRSSIPKPKCFSCGSEKHLKLTCPENAAEKTTTTNKQKSKVKLVE